MELPKRRFAGILRLTSKEHPFHTCQKKFKIRIAASILNHTFKMEGKTLLVLCLLLIASATCNAQGGSTTIPTTTTAPIIDLSSNVTTELNRGYKTAFPAYRRSNIEKFSRGSPFTPPILRVDSVQVLANLIFDNQSSVPSASLARTTLIKALNSSEVSLNVNTSSITAEIRDNTTTTTPSTITTTSSAWTANKPQEVVSFLLPLILAIYFLSSNEAVKI
ncbi:hypothetical protein GJAV_G00065590 [Gymnothorax javanicus]|nr:hypothetical protein GJAV_G00065590 [Gymnothorax javanicus]